VSVKGACERLGPATSWMRRVPEPELMDDDAQVRAYAEADFEEPHRRFLSLFQAQFPGQDICGYVLDLGCGPADITVRFARAHPRAIVHGVDAAPNMLKYGRRAVARHGLEARIVLLQGYLPGATLPRPQYQCVISNSLLHHLRDPQALWDTVRQRAASGAPVFVMDLTRPETRQRAWRLVQTHSAGEPRVLQRDFFNSLCAAYTPAEIERQLGRARLVGFSVRQVSDRHVAVTGRA
jgi:SAM-dependent methyltransferase